MKQLNFVVFFFILILQAACTKKKDEVEGKLNTSFGNRNEVVVVMDDSLWIGATGDSIRAKLAKPTIGLADEEPIFDLVQLDPKIFSTRAKNARNIVLFSTQTAHEFILEKSLNASPQNFFFVRAKTNHDLVKLFNKNADSIISVFKTSELNEEMHETVRTSTQDLSELKDFFGCTVKIPNAYHLQVENEFPFLWYQKDLSSGNLNIVMYEFPISEIENSKGSIEQHLIEARDYIGREFIKTAKDSAYTITDQVLPPLITKQKVQDLPAYQILGNWNTINDFLKGTFVCYAIRDEYYKRYLFIEGYINNPFKNKRDQLLELEAIIKTINFNEN